MPEWRPRRVALLIHFSIATADSLQYRDLNRDQDEDNSEGALDRDHPVWTNTNQNAALTDTMVAISSIVWLRDISGVINVLNTPI